MMFDEQLFRAPRCDKHAIIFELANLLTPQNNPVVFELARACDMSVDHDWSKVSSC